MEKGNLTMDLKEHKNQVWRLIWLPFIFGVLLTLFLAVFIIVTSSGNEIESGRIAGFSLIIVIFPALFISAAVIIVLGLFIFGLYKLTVIIPVYSFKLLMVLGLVYDFVRLWSDRLISPVIVVKSWGARVNRIFSIFSHNPHK